MTKKRRTAAKGRARPAAAPAAAAAVAAAQSPRPTGRPSTYDRDVATAICDRLAAGESLTTICAGPGMPPIATFRGWVVDNVDGLGARHTRAREIQALGWVEEIVEIADRENLDADRRRAMLDTRKWLVAKVLRKIYGDKLAVSGEDGGAIKLSVDERTARVRAVVEALMARKGKAKK